MRRPLASLVICVLVFAAAGCDDSSSDSSGSPDSSSGGNDDAAAAFVDDGATTLARSDSGDLNIETTSTRASTVSDGQVLITVFGSAALDGVVVTRDGED